MLIWLNQGFTILQMRADPLSIALIVAKDEINKSNGLEALFIRMEILSFLAKEVSSMALPL